MTERHPPGPPSRKRPADRISTPVITVNLESELKSLKVSPSYKRNDHASATIVNRPGLGAVLIALPKGGHLAEHRTARPIMLRVLEGRIRVSLEDRDIEMARGDLTALAPDLRHRVLGLEDSAFLLTMGGGNRQRPAPG
jgi:quercetin dioxygenase-like cupin family protein